MSKACPKCHSPVSEGASDCPKCGINFSGYERYLAHHHPSEPSQRPAIIPAQRPAHRAIHANFGTSSLDFLNSVSSVKVQQNEGLFRIVTGWQTRNRYVIIDPLGQTLGYIAERDTGFLSSVSRQFFGSRRSLTIDVFNLEGQPVAQIKRPWFWFFSELTTFNPQGSALGVVKYRFTFFKPKYELSDSQRQVFTYLESSILGGATLMDSIAGNRMFTAYSPMGGRTGGSITRTWKGLLNRALTAEDCYQVEFSPEWSAEQKITFLAASISIDLDFYENEKGLVHRAGELSPLGIIFGRWGSPPDDGGNI